MQSRNPFVRMLSAAILAMCTTLHAHAERPNIVYILADDLGYGDVRHYNPESKIPTPNIDRIAREGIAFTDAHSSSAVCTPTRYNILTGRYNWRTRIQSGVLWGHSAPLIAPNRPTVATFLKAQGYATACVGKWHLGLGWGGEEIDDEIKDIDYARRIKGGPVDLGFDYFFGIPASLDMTPYVYVENDRVVAPATDTIAERSGQAFYRGGPIAPGFVIEDVLSTLGTKAVTYIDDRLQQNSEQPFFLYFPLTAPHTPILPSIDFAGKSAAGVYGDFVHQVDWIVGQILAALDRNGAADNTLIIFTSDNGCSPMADFRELAALGHHPSHIYRGHKADIYEGGHRVPFVARWPKGVTPGLTSNQTVSIGDLFATAADILDVPLAADAAVDSVSFAPALAGNVDEPLREAIVHHSIHGDFAIRQGDWKLAFCPGSGGWSTPTPDEARRMDLPSLQLFNLREDPGEQTNLIAKHPDVAARLTALMQRYVDRGRSTPGPDQPNDAPIERWAPE